MTNPTRRQKGVGLVELMIGLTIGLIIVAATGSIYLTSLRGGADATRSAKLNMELRSAMSTVVSAIRRAGYLYSASSTDTTVNPFMQATSNLTIPSSSCVLFAYDADQSGTISSADFFGFKKSGDAIAMRSGGDAPTTSSGCAVANDSWEKITDDNNVVIDTVAFYDYDPDISGSVAGDLFQCWDTAAETSETAPCVTGKTVYDSATAKSRLVETRSLVVQLTGHHKADPDMRISLKERVRVRNDRILVKP